MTVDIADRLAALRKAHGYSQEELADKIGVSRQAISKWERTESSPDTDNLIALANLYGVSLDELLGRAKDDSGEQVFGEDSKINTSENSDEDYIELDLDNLGDSIKNTIKSEIKKESKNVNVSINKRTNLEDVVIPAVSIAALIAYLILGFTVERGWAVYWTLFILVPVFGSLADAIDSRDAEDFCFPALVAFIYFFGGMYWGLWHPYWIEFVTVPIYYLTVELINKAIKKKKNNGEIDENDDEDDDDENHVVRIMKGKGNVVITKGKGDKYVRVDVPGVKIEVEKSDED